VVLDLVNNSSKTSTVEKRFHTMAMLKCPSCKSPKIRFYQGVPAQDTYYAYEVDPETGNYGNEVEILPRIDRVDRVEAEQLYICHGCMEQWKTWDECKSQCSDDIKLTKEKTEIGVTMDKAKYQEELEAVKQDGEALKSVPEELKTPELCLVAVKQHGLALGDVPEELQTREILLEAVKQDGSAIEYVPEHELDDELCLEAVKEWGGALEHVPYELITPELCLVAVKQGVLKDDWGSPLRYVPENLKTPELCLVAVKSRGDALECVPKELKEAVEREVKTAES
jgi:hypothetical protein